MEYTMENIPRLLEIAALRRVTRLKDIEYLCNIAKAWGCAATIVHPCFLTFTLKNTVGYEGILKCAAISYPLGADLTSVKVYAAKQADIMGAQEVSVAINMNAFVSGNYGYVKQEIDAVCDSVKAPVTVTMETSMLEGEELVKSARLVSKTKAACLQTSTGFWESTPTAEVLTVLRESLDEGIQLKAAGDVASAQELLELAALGVDRFNLDMECALHILQDADKALGREPVTL